MQPDPHPTTIAQLAEATGGDRRTAQRWLLTTPDERLSPELLAEKRRLQLEVLSRSAPVPQRQSPWHRYRTSHPLMQVGLGCLALVVVLFTCALCTGGLPSLIRGIQQGYQQSSAPPVAVDTPTQDATPAPQWTITNTFSGSGTKNTTTFTVTGDWQLNWTCAPASFATGQYNVIVDVDSPGQSLPVFPSAVNAICSANVYSGTTEEYQSGTFYLAVNSEAQWNVQIEQLL
jgi:hypothetical protein